MITLDTLPTELLFMILDLLKWDRYLVDIGLVSRRFYQIFVLYRYRTITFSSENEWSLNSLTTRRFIESRSPIQVASHLGLVRNLRFTAPFRVAQFNRCSFRTSHWYRKSLGQYSDAKHFHSDIVWDLLEQLGYILKHLKHGALLSFWWHLGTCMPSRVFGEDGYIPTSQPNIIDLSLRTDPHCPHTGHQLGGLRQLNKLQSLRWQRIVTSKELELAIECLEHNSRTLKLLDLEFVPTIMSTSFITAVRKLAHLRVLSLGEFRFTQFIDAALCLSALHLRSLTLRNCPHQLLLLQVLASLNEPLPLKHFEIALDEVHSTDALSETAENALYSFLGSFDTLEHLHLLVSNPRRYGRYLQVTKNHPLLKSFIYHTRSYVMGPTRSQSTLCMPVHLLADLGSVLSESVLQSIGLCLSPVTAKALFQELEAETHIQILHLRLSGSEYHSYDLRKALLQELACQDRNVPFADTQGYSSRDLDWNEAGTGLFEVQANIMSISHFIRLADWAFGQHGIKSLKILAYGDFSCGDRYKKQQAILVRESLDSTPISVAASFGKRPYRVVLQQSEFLEKYPGVADTVSSCSLEALMDTNDNIWSL